MMSAFAKLKQELSNATVLSFPTSAAELLLQTDTSDTAVGAVLQQSIVCETRPLSFFSRKPTPTQQRYWTYDRVLLAVYEAIKRFRHFLEYRDFYMLMDHKPLVFAFKKKQDQFTPRQTETPGFYLGIYYRLAPCIGRSQCRRGNFITH